MGSVKHPRYFDRVESESIRNAFHEIFDAVLGQAALKFECSEDELKSRIIRQLIALAGKGTPPTDWKSEVLKSLPLW